MPATFPPSSPSCLWKMGEGAQILLVQDPGNKGSRAVRCAHVGGMGCHPEGEAMEIPVEIPPA